MFKHSKQDVQQSHIILMATTVVMSLKLGSLSAYTFLLTTFYPSLKSLIFLLAIHSLVFKFILLAMEVDGLVMVVL